jgi:hypothetical protein
MCVEFVIIKVFKDKNQYFKNPLHQLLTNLLIQEVLINQNLRIAELIWII